MKELEYPFDSEWIIKKKKHIKKQLLSRSGIEYISKKIAILGGSTTNDIKNILEVFLLNYGIKPSFYESEYNQYYQDAMFDSSELVSFAPDIIFIHTTNRNIKYYPEITDSKESILEKIEKTYSEFEAMWNHLFEKYCCPIIQNNFEHPFFRYLGNRDCVDIHGRVRFINQLNNRFCEYAESHDNFYIHDINYLAASYGLDKWSDPFYWHMYKYALSVPAIPSFAFSLSHIIKAIYGKNKKAFVLDLDNTLWGGVVGDDGPEKLEIGLETSEGQAYLEFQKYIKTHKAMGILLNISSKNDEDNALLGLNHPDGVLRPEDFILIKANWNPKSGNINTISKELNIGADSIVFVDDNPAEREIVTMNLPAVETPNITTVDQYIRIIDKNGYFEVLKLSKDDLTRSGMYKENLQRAELMNSYEDYGDYLKSLNMKATIKPFDAIHTSRIAQLTNKSNQFNLTTKRYTVPEIEAVASSGDYLTFYGRLEDKFGDNGLVTVAIGRKENCTLHLDLWLMSCRVLKRDMELALLDELVRKSLANGISSIIGYYYPTSKNGMVRSFYEDLGFELIREDDMGNTEWKLMIDSGYSKKNKYIEVIDYEQGRDFC